jgi:hypothetical protein
MVRWQSPAALMALMGLACTSLVGCEAVKGIFKAGVWVGVIVAVVVVALLAGLGRLIGRR